MSAAINIAIELTNTVHNYLLGIDGSHLKAFLIDWPSQPFQTRTVLQNSLPVLSHLPQLDLRANQNTQRIVQHFENSAKHLTWGQTYSSNDFGPSFLKNYGWTELIGMRGPIKSTVMACGMLLLGPHIEYPLHSHEAEEIYVPLTFPTYWKKDSEDWRAQPCGIPIYHKSWQPHGMQTESTPLLALYLWRGGNLTQKSHIAH